MNAHSAEAARPLFERLWLRAGFALVVIGSTPRVLGVKSIPAPNGLARLIDLTFLTDPLVARLAYTAVIAAMLLYIFRLALALVLPVATLIHTALNAVLNSQGAIEHATQIVSLTLLAQSAAHFYSLWRREDGNLREERLISWTLQTIAAVYFVAALTKLITTAGAWPFRARYVAVQIYKGAYQAYYDQLDPSQLEERLRLAEFAARHEALVATIALGGLLLELSAPLMLINRRAALGIGAALLLFHLVLDRAMELTFLWNQLLLVVYAINPLYWIVAGSAALIAMLRKPR